MRYIQKGDSPQSFEDWKNKANENWQPSWGDFQNPEKKIVKEALLKEQGYICCYCGMNIENDCNTEIEHIKPRSKCIGNESDKTLAFDNFLASCNGSTQEPKPREVHCNNARRDQDLAISPLTVGCGENFSYTYGGEMISSEGDENISRLIDNVLNLNAKKVKGYREKLIKALDHDFRDKDVSEVSEEIDSLLHKINGRFKGMCFVSVSYLESQFL